MTSVAPFYIDLESPVPESGIPKPGALTVHLKDDHMQYAITWFALAGAVVIAFGVVVARAAAKLWPLSERLPFAPGKSAEISSVRL